MINNKEYLKVQFCPPKYKPLSRDQVTSHVKFLLRKHQLYFNKINLFQFLILTGNIHIDQHNALHTTF